MARLLVHSHTLHAPLLAGLLAQFCGVEILVCSSGVATTRATLETSAPDLLLLEVDLDGSCCPGLSCRPGLEGCRSRALLGDLVQLHPAARVILMAPACGLEAWLAQLPAELMAAVIAVVDATLSWPELLQRVREQLAALPGPQPAINEAIPDPACFHRLRPRERSVLQLLGMGLVSKEIARSLGLTLRTVETYRKTLCAKLGVSGAQLVRVAVLQACIAPCAVLVRELGAAASTSPSRSRGRLESSGDHQVRAVLGSGIQPRPLRAAPPAPPATSGAGDPEPAEVAQPPAPSRGLVGNR